ncbi:MAG: type VI secretion system lipoprotein TssJ [Desulfobacterales bacterium]|nr:type VI secretion system lipoprotein TssJ [Desulfobacterales bacterium]
MNKSAATLTILMSFFLIVSCASRPPLAPPEWRFEKDAVKLTFQADPNLNLYNNISHTLQLCVYQLKDPNGFNQRVQTEDGLYSLLACSLFDASVANFRSVIVRPGENISFAMDRAEGAKYIGIAAGYAEIEKDRITRLIEIPAVIVDEGGGFSSRQVAKPDTINLNLRLGPLQIETGTGE